MLGLIFISLGSQCGANRHEDSDDHDSDDKTNSSASVKQHTDDRKRRDTNSMGLPVVIGLLRTDGMDTQAEQKNISSR